MYHQLRKTFKEALGESWQHITGNTLAECKPAEFNMKNKLQQQLPKYHFIQ